jgi:hypothetical protein
LSLWNVDAANRDAFRAETIDAPDLVGLAVCGPKKDVDRAVNGDKLGGSRLYEDQVMFFELGGENNLTTVRGGREIRSRSCTLPESYIRKARNIERNLGDYKSR